MINKIGKSPTLPFPTNTVDPGTSGFLTVLIRQIMDGFQSIINVLGSIADQMNSPTVPVLMPTYVKTGLPSAADNVNGVIVVSNDVGGLTLAFSDGTNWRRTADRNVIS